MVVLWGFDGADPFCFLKPMVCACLRDLKHRSGFHGQTTELGARLVRLWTALRESNRYGQSRAAVDPSLV